jgi:NADPH:quinone reductase-like Zn-dependent oxidoreductase
MKAVFLTSQGEANALQYGDLPDPEPGPGEVLVRVRATSINRRDVFEREGSHGVKLGAERHVPGLDIAGEVAALGAEAAHQGRFAVGDRVFGVATGGAYAELARAAIDELQPLPANLSFEEAAAVPTVYAAAYRALVVRAHMHMGEEVLVMAGGSGVGSAAIQLAKVAGCRVLTTASSQAKLDKAQALGAEVGINYREIPEFSRAVLQHTAGRGVDLVYEHIGVAVFEQAYRSIAIGGRLVTNGVTTGHLVQLHLGRLWTREVSLIGSTMHPGEDLGAVLPLLQRGQVHGVVDRVLPLKNAAEGHRVLESNEFFGKVVLAV